MRTSMNRKVNLLFLLFLLLILIIQCGKIENLAKGQQRLEYVRADKMNLLIPASVFLPEQYYKSDGAAEKRYPVIYLLHGYAGDHAQWSRITDLKKLANQTKIIFVCPDAGYDSWYFDTFSDTANFYYERHIMREVITHIDTVYRTWGARARAITGLSMGGHGALRFISLYPDSFVAAGSMSGILDLREFPDSWHIARRLGPFSKFSLRWGKNSCVNLVARLRGKNKGLIVECGSEDFAISVNRAYRDSARVHGIELTFTEDAGAHTAEYWKTHLENQVKFLMQYFLPPLD